MPTSTSQPFRMSNSDIIGGDGAEYEPFTKAEHIKQLNDIDKSITQLLQSAGLALKTLSSTQTSASTSERQDAFRTSSNAYLKTLQSVDARLKRQIWALEEASIIPAEKSKVKPKSKEELSRPLGGAKAAVSSEAAQIEGSMGKLDIGWLNSRSGRVERDMEAELWEKAREFLEETQAEGDNGITRKESDDSKGG